jgi:hypothetical protein
MMNETKIGRLWLGFRRLSEGDKTLVLQFASLMPQKLKPGNDQNPVKKLKLGRDKTQI